MGHARAADAVVVVGITLAQLRVLRVVGDELWSTNLFGRDRISHERGAIGVRVRVSRGHRFYTLYLHDAETGHELDLAEALSQRGAARLRAQLTALIHPEGPLAVAAASKAVVEAREAEYQRAVAQAQALAGGRRPVMIAMIVLVVISLVTVIAVAIDMLE